MKDANATSSEVVLIVPNHSITGTLHLGAVRLSDWLNDVRNSWIALYTVEFARLSDPAKAIHVSSKAIIPKAMVVIAFELEQGTLTAEQRFYAYRKKRAYSVFLATDMLEVRGVVHVAPTESAPDLTMMKLDRFIPVTRAVVALYGLDAYEIRQDSIMVNAQAIKYFSVSDEVVTEE